MRPITDTLGDACDRIERLRRDCDHLVAAAEGTHTPHALALPGPTGPTLENVGALAVLVDRVEAYLDQLADEIAKVRMAMGRAIEFVPLPARDTQPGDAA